MEINHIDKYIQKKILKFLYENRDGRLITNSKIRKGIKTDYYVRNIDQYLERLKSDGYVKSKIVKIPAITTGVNKMKADSYPVYYITTKGIEFVKNDFNNEPSSFDKLIDVTMKIENNTYETAINTSVIKEALENVLNSMGIQHQEILRGQIAAKHLLEEYIRLIESSDSDKESKIQGFLKSIGGEIAAPLIVEYLKMKIGI